jgi:hypothetical protein
MRIAVLHQLSLGVLDADRCRWLELGLDVCGITAHAELTQH